MRVAIDKLNLTRVQLQTVANKMICTIRLILALSALIVIFVDPREPDTHVLPTYLALVAYTLYSAALWLLRKRQTGAQGRIFNWIDIAWYTGLISLSSGTNSVFFCFFFLPVVVASFSWGKREGLQTAIASALLFSVFGYLFAPAGPEFNFSRFVLRPVYLIAFGYMTAFWGAQELKLKNRLALLEEVTSLSNTKFSINYTISLILDRIRSFYSADKCLLIIYDQKKNNHYLYRRTRGEPEDATDTELISADEARLLLPLPDHYAIIHREKSKGAGFRGGKNRSLVYNTLTNKLDHGQSPLSNSLAELLETESFISVPYNYRDEVFCRVYLISPGGACDVSDAHFLQQVFAQVVPLIDNIMLIGKLASDAAVRERQRVAHDIHDSIIQPFIGLQISLNVLECRVRAGKSDIEAEIKRLGELAGGEIARIRHYLGILRGLEKSGGMLQMAVHRLVKKFTDASGIQVQLDLDEGLRPNDRLTAEVFQVVTEGLSNIRRHAEATEAFITLKRLDDSLYLRIENDNRNGEPAKPFTPKSITERVAALEGRVEVRQRQGGGTVLEVEIPLPPRLV
jgi:signal transduction histidine kinase